MIKNSTKNNTKNSTMNSAKNITRFNTVTIDLLLRSLIGFICLCTAFAGYFRTPEYMVELTFFSNAIVGSMYFISVIYEIKSKKKLPSLLYFNAMIVLMLVFLISLAFSLNFSGAFIFLHVINPLSVFFHCLLFCNVRGCKPVLVLTSLIVPVMYFLFAFIYGQISGNYLYPFMNVETNGILYVFGFGIVILLLMTLLIYSLFLLNHLVHKSLQKFS